MARTPDYYKNAIEKLRETRGNKCEECGRTQAEAKLLHRNGLEFAHIMTTGLSGRSRGLPQRYHDIVKHPAHYKLLCRECHTGFDSNGGPAMPEETPF